MTLLAFQTGLARGFLTADPTASPGDDLELTRRERSRLRRILDSRGYRFTVAVQRSWCEGRAANTARRTLSLLPAAERRRLVAAWAQAGGGRSAFIAVEADAFLEFVAAQLPSPSHAVTMARVEQAVFRAADGAATFAPPDPARVLGGDTVLRAGRHAALVHFYAEPHSLLDAIERGGALPPLVEPGLPVLFAPGLDGLFRLAGAEEVALWHAFAEPVDATRLVREGHARGTIAGLVAIGAVECA